jgi:hypothetical protein
MDGMAVDFVLENLFDLVIHEYLNALDCVHFRAAAMGCIFLASRSWEPFNNCFPPSVVASSGWQTPCALCSSDYKSKAFAYAKDGIAYL